MNKLNKYYQLWIPILLGISAFILVTGGKIIWPSNINWLFLNDDTANGLFAWQFFRHTPIFQNPLGANYPYGMGMGGSIIYAEPLFLFAFPFKLLSSILPTPFQYTGLWIFLCFVLQAIFSWKLLEKITNDKGLKFLGSTFFVLAPAFLWRLHASLPLCGQWLILAAILLNLSIGYHRYIWTSLIIISSLVHPYLLFMLLALWTADLIQRKFLNELTFQKIIKYIFFTSLILALVIWQAGYFMVHNGLEAWGFGYFRINLLSFIDPTDGLNFNSWSHILRIQPKITEEHYEGFVYLGLGMLVLGALGLSKLIEPRQIKVVFFNFKKVIPLLIICLLLMLYALSNRVALGHYELIQYTLPAIFNIFRASGRMALPIYYLIYLVSLYLIIKCFKKSSAKVLIAICLVIQIADSFNIYTNFRNYLNHPKPYVSPLTSPIWTEVAKKYKKLIYVLPVFNWQLIPLICYSAFNRLNINVGYFARIDNEKLNTQKIHLLANLLQGRLDHDAFYVMNDLNIQKKIINTKMNFPYKVIKINGFALLLPNWHESSTKTERINWAQYNLYKLGKIIYFQTPESNFKDYFTLINGWSTPEGEGTWTDGDSSILLFHLAERPYSNLILTIDALPFINVKHPTLIVDIIINGRFIGQLAYDIMKYSAIRKIEIPNSIIGVNNLLEIEFIFKNAISPVKLALSSDSRKLGLFISSVRLTSKKDF